MNNKIKAVFFTALTVSICDCAEAEASQNPQSEIKCYVIDYPEQQIEEIDKDIERWKQGIDTLKDSPAEPSLLQYAIIKIQNQISTLQAKKELLKIQNKRKLI